MKKCTKCQKEKPISEFYKSKATEDGYQYHCKECSKAMSKAYFQTDKGKTALKKYLESDKGKATLKKSQKKYLESDKGKAALKRGQKKLTEKGYYRFGKGAIPVLKEGANRRGIKFNLTAEELEKWWLATEDMCCYCKITTDEFIYLRDFVLEYEGNSYQINKFKNIFNNRNHAKIRWMTIDRRDNAKGYEIENIVKCCWFCNYIKGVYLTYEDMNVIAERTMHELKNEVEKESNNT